MASNLLLRRATRSLVPLAARAVSAPTAATFPRTLTTLSGFRKQSVGVRNILPAAAAAAASRGFTSKTVKDYDGIRSFLDSEPSPKLDLFEVEEITEDHKVFYVKWYNSEVFKVQAYVPSQVEKEDDVEFFVQLVVCSRNENGSGLGFGIRAFNDELKIDHVTFRKQATDDQTVYEWSEFDGNTQAVLRKFLEVRGIQLNSYFARETHLNVLSLKPQLDFEKKMVVLRLTHSPHGILVHQVSGI